MNAVDSSVTLHGALEWARLIGPVTPARADGKQPELKFLENFDKASTRCPDQIHKWWGRGGKYEGHAALGLTGFPSNMLVIDSDNQEAIKWAEGLKATALRVATGRVGGGEHRWYRMPTEALRIKYGRLFPATSPKAGQPGYLSQRTRGHLPDHVGGVAIDAKCMRNYCVIPGSVHKTGRVYTILGGLTLEQAVAGLGEWDEDCFKTLEKICFCHSDKCSGHLRGFRESAATVASRNAEIVRKANWEARKCRGEVLGEYRHHDVSATDKFRRAARYMEKVEGVSKGGAGREPTAFRLACRLRRGFDLTVNETLCLLERWNVNNDPPLPDSVLIAKAQQARDRGTEAIGGMLRVQAENVIITSEGVEIREDKVKPPSVLNSGRRLARYLRLLNSFAVNDPRRKRVSRNIACCKVFGTLVCKTHGPQGVKTFPCGSPSCSHCMTKRARAQRDHINKTWPEQVAVLEVETTLAEQNGLDSLGAARNLRIGPVRNAFRGGEGGMDHRWLIGTSRVVVFAGEDRIPLLRRVGKKLKAGHRKTRINVMPRWQAAQLVLRTWTEPSSELDALLDSDLPDDVVHGKLRSLKIWDPEVRIVRTRGNQGGEEKFPWLSLEAMTAELVERAKKRRGDLPWNKCAHVLPGGEHCCADLTCHLVIKQTGELIGEFDTDKAWELSRKALSFGLSASLDLANLPPP